MRSAKSKSSPRVPTRLAIRWPLAATVDWPRAVRSLGLAAGLVFQLPGIGCNQGPPPEPERRPGAPSPGPSAVLPPRPAVPGVAPVRRLPVPQTGAVIAGRAIFVGPPPPAAPQPRGSDPFCARLERFDDSLVVDPHGGLRSVLVRVVEGAGGPYAPPTTPVTLTQAECRYQPRVLGAVRGQPVLVSNSDGTLHNVHALLGSSTVLNQVQVDAAAPLIDLRHVVAGAAGNPLQLRCDVHPWMTAYVWVLEQPFFAVTSEDGSFSIKNLPAGDYVLEAWHERLGIRRAKLALTASATPAKPAKVEFRFTLEATPALSPQPGKPAALPVSSGG